MARQNNPGRGAEPSESAPLIGSAYDCRDFGAWIYPLQGIVYLCTHPILFRPLAPRFLTSLLISLAVIILMFFWTYLPQAAFLAIFIIHGRLALVNAAIMVLSESATIIAFILENIVLEEPLINVYDAVLVEEGFDDLVSQGRILLPEGKDSVEKLGEFKRSPFVKFSCGLLVEWLFEMPLNLIPIVGAPLFIILQGYRAGPIAHYHYYQLLGFKRKERNQVIKRKRWGYLGFGTVALTLQIVPVVSTFFCITMAIGAALWTVRIERAKLLRQLNATDGSSAPVIEP